MDTSLDELRYRWTSSQHEFGSQPAWKGNDSEYDYDMVPPVLQQELAGILAVEQTMSTTTAPQSYGLSYIPTWEELDEVSARIKRLCALRSILLELEQRSTEPEITRDEELSEDHDPIEYRYYPVTETETSPENSSQALAGYNQSEPVIDNSDVALPPTPDSQATTDEYGPEHEDEEYIQEKAEPVPRRKYKPKRDPFMPTNPAESKSEIKEILKQFRSFAKKFRWPSHLDFVVGQRFNPPPLANTYNNLEFSEYRRELVILMQRLQSDVPRFGDSGVNRAAGKAMDIINCELCDLAAHESKLWAKHLRAQYKKNYRKSLQQWMSDIKGVLVCSKE